MLNVFCPAVTVVQKPVDRRAGALASVFEAANGAVRDDGAAGGTEGTTCDSVGTRSGEDSTVLRVRGKLNPRPSPGPYEARRPGVACGQDTTRRSLLVSL